MQSSVEQNFVQFTKPFEGTVNYMYLDIKGLVTVGIGNLIDPVNLALALPFVHNSDNSPASQSEIQAEWTKVKQNAKLAQQGYKAAAPPFTTLKLTDAAITQLVGKQLNANQAILKQTFTDFESWPADAQLGLLSMAWGLGAGFASKWPLFKAACLARNWSSAAQNCQISTAGNPGVAPRNTANVLLFNNAQAVADQKLDYSVLHWPNSVAASSSGSGSTAGDTSPLGSGTGSAGDSANGSGTGSTTDGGSSTDSTSSTTDPGNTNTTDTSGGDDTPTGGDESTSNTDPGSASTSGDDSTNVNTTDTSTGEDSTSAPTSASSSEGSDGSDGTGASPDENGTTTSDGSDDVTAADPVGAQS